MSDNVTASPNNEQDLFAKYDEEFINDTKIDEFSLKERAMTVVAIKHKWVGRLMRHKRDLKKLEIAKKQAISKLATKLANSDVGLTEVAAKKAATNNDLIIRIQDEMEKQELIIEYLEKVEKILNSMTYDIKNLLDIQKMETM